MLSAKFCSNMVRVMLGWLCDTSWFMCVCVCALFIIILCVVYTSYSLPMFDNNDNEEGRYAITHLFANIS